jgi:hypothetical protein
MSKAASSEKRIVSAFIALHGNIRVNIADYHQPTHTFLFDLVCNKIPGRYNLYAPDNLGRFYTVTDPNTADYISKKIEEWEKSLSKASGKASPRSHSASPRSRSATFSEFIAGDLTHFEQKDSEAIFKDIDDIYEDSHKYDKGKMPKDTKEDTSYLHTSALIKNEVKWKKHDYYITGKQYIVSDDKRPPEAKIDIGKEIIVVIETIHSDGTRSIKNHRLKLESLPTFFGMSGIEEVASCLISEYSLDPTDEINLFDFTCSVIGFPTRLYGLGQYNMNLLSSNRNKDGSATLTFGTISIKRSFEDAFRDDGGNDDGSPSADSPSSMKVNTPGSRRSSLSSPKDSPAGHKSPYSPTVSGGPTIVVNVPEALVSYVSFTGHRHGGGRVRRKYTRRKQYTRKTRP